LRCSRYCIRISKEALIFVIPCSLDILSPFSNSLSLSLVSGISRRIVSIRECTACYSVKLAVTLWFIAVHLSTNFSLTIKFLLISNMSSPYLQERYEIFRMVSSRLFYKDTNKQSRSRGPALFIYLY